MELGCGLTLHTLGVAGAEDDSAEAHSRRKLGNRGIVQRDNTEAQF